MSLRERLRACGERFNVGHEPIGDQGALEIAAAILEEVNPGLARLDLHHCDIDDTGCAVLAYALCSHASSKTCGSTHSTAITVLRLHHNRITSDGAAFLAHALYLNSTLLQLDLEYNQIGPAGALALSDALMINQGLTTLQLDHNPISDDGAQFLAGAIKFNTTLTTLSLLNTEITPVGCQLLLDALRLNTTLTAPNMFYLTKQGYTLWMPTIVERKQRRGKYVLEDEFVHLSRSSAHAATKRGLMGQGSNDFSLVSPSGLRAPGHCLSFEELSIFDALLRGARKWGMSVATAMQSLILPLSLIHPPINLMLEHSQNAWETAGTVAMRALARLDLYQPSTQCVIVCADRWQCLFLARSIVEIACFCTDARFAVLIPDESSAFQGHPNVNTSAVPHIVIGTPAAVARAARRTGDTFIDMRACSLLIGYAADGLFVDSVYDYLAEIKSKLSKQSVQVILFSSSEFNPAFASRVQRFCPNAFRIVKALDWIRMRHWIAIRHRRRQMMMQHQQQHKSSRSSLRSGSVTPVQAPTLGVSMSQPNLSVDRRLPPAMPASQSMALLPTRLDVSTPRSVHSAMYIASSPARAAAPAPVPVLASPSLTAVQPAADLDSCNTCRTDALGPPSLIRRASVDMLRFAPMQSPLARTIPPSPSVPVTGRSVAPSPLTSPLAATAHLAPFTLSARISETSDIGTDTRSVLSHDSEPEPVLVDVEHVQNCDALPEVPLAFCATDAVNAAGIVLHTDNTDAFPSICYFCAIRLFVDQAPDNLFQAVLKFT